MGSGQRTVGTVVGERVAGKEAKEGSEAGVSGARYGVLVGAGLQYKQY